MWGIPAEPVVRATKAVGFEDVSVKSGCRISTPGVAPWLPPGSKRSLKWEQASYSALLEMGLPPEAASLAVIRMKEGTTDGALGMSNLNGVGSGSDQLFFPTYHTTYRKGDKWVVCRDSATAFANDERQEWAVLYRIPDAKGQIWHVGEFLVCGNLSVFQPAPYGWMPRKGVLPADPYVTPPALIGSPHSPPVGLHGPILIPPPPAVGVHRPTPVPEPSGLALALVGLLGVVLFHRKGK